MLFASKKYVIDTSPVGAGEGSGFLLSRRGQTGSGPYTQLWDFSCSLDLEGQDGLSRRPGCDSRGHVRDAQAGAERMGQQGPTPNSTALFTSTVQQRRF